MTRYFLLFAFWSAVSLSQTETVSRTFTGVPIRTLKIAKAAGDVTINGVVGAVASVIAQKEKFDGNCDLQISEQAGRLEILVADHHWFRSDACVVRLAVTVPRELDLEYRSHSGILLVSGIAGNISLRTAKGSVAIEKSEIETLTVHAGGTALNLAGIFRNAEIENCSGKTAIRYSAVPSQGSLIFSTGVGEFAVEMPAEAISRLDSLRQRDRSFVDELTHRVDAPFAISYRGQGPVALKRLTPGA